MPLRTSILGPLLGLAIGARQKTNVMQRSQEQEASSLELSRCTCVALWLSLPVPTSILQNWLKEQVEKGDVDELPELETPEHYAKKFEGSHPLWIEFDSMEDCKSVGFFPTSDFQEIAIQIPYMKWKGQSVKFQPWAFTDTDWGATALGMLGARTKQGDPFDRDFNGDWWTQSAKVDDPRSVFNVSAWVDGLEPHESLQANDETWREIAKGKLAPSLGYKKNIWGHGQYACHTIAYDLESANVTKVGKGSVDLLGPKYLPRAIQTKWDDWSNVGNVEAYAVRIEYGANTGGCK